MTNYKKFKANFEYQQKMISKGFGDSVEKFTKATGIKKMVDTVSTALDKDCGCDKRRKRLNDIFPFVKPKLLTEEEFVFLDQVFTKEESQIPQPEKILGIYNRVFSDKQKITNCSPCFVGTVYNKLKKIWYEYK
jgi:hypothetical protein